MSIKDCLHTILKSLFNFPLDEYLLRSEIISSLCDNRTINEVLDDEEPDLEHWRTIKNFIIRDIFLQWVSMILELKWESCDPDVEVSQACKALLQQLKKEFRERGPVQPKAKVERLLDATVDEDINELFRKSLLDTLVPNDYYDTSALTVQPYDPNGQPKLLLAISSQLGENFGYAHFVLDYYHFFQLLRSVAANEADFKAILEIDHERLQKLVDVLDTSDMRFFRTPFCKAFADIRYNMIFSVARGCGVVPSSLFVNNTEKIGDCPIGGGGFADVWKGCLHFEGCNCNEPHLVALKFLRTFKNATEEQTLKQTRSLCREAYLWKMAQHENVLKFMGVSRFPDGQVALTSLWMGNGNLLDHVKGHPETNRANLLFQAAKGLIYLHSIGIVHGDLKCANIMVDDEGKPRLSDFGLSSIISSPGGVALATSSNSGGNPRWLAPELMFPDECNGNGEHTNESDYYAFGMTALELFTEKVPFYDMIDAAIPLEVTLNKKQPIWPGREAEDRGLTANIWAMMTNCWTYEPSPRSSKFHQDILDLTVSDIGELRLNSSSCVDDFCDYTIGKIKGRNKNSSETGWLSYVWHVTFERDDGTILPYGYTLLTSRAICISRQHVNILARQFRSCQDIEPHNNVAPFVGSCDLQLPLAFSLIYDISPAVESLSRYMQHMSETVWSEIEGIEIPRVTIGPKSRIEMMLQIANGLSYLHMNGIVHGDLRSANVVVDNHIALLVDYGMPRCVRPYENILAEERKQFQAPELWNHCYDRDPTKESDIYAMGMTFYEILTDKMPFSDIVANPPPDFDFETDVIRKGVRPSYPAGNVAERRGLSEELWSLMCRCWAARPGERPTAVEVMSSIERMGYQFWWKCPQDDVYIIYVV